MTEKEIVLKWCLAQGLIEVLNNTGEYSLLLEIDDQGAFEIQDLKGDDHFFGTISALVAFLGGIHMARKKEAERNG